MRKISAVSLSFFVAFFSISELLAEEKKYPNVVGQIFSQVSGDRVLSSGKASGVSPNNAYLYSQADVALNFDKNWSASTQWRLQPNNVFTTRNDEYPERYRTFFSQGRGFRPSDEGLLVEEIKLNYRSDDAIFSLGKFDPKFGSTYDKTAKLGIFTPQIGEDYNLREKIGGNITALLEHSKISFNTFMNDTTGLSSSAFNNRGRSSSKSGYAGSTGTISSYSVTMEGSDLFGEENWHYNIGYRSLGTDSGEGRKREVGYVLSSSYIYEMGAKTTITPFFEMAKINNFNGEAGRDATYTTLAVTFKHSSWNIGVSNINRNISQLQRDRKISDRFTQIYTGYKFSEKLSFDVTHARIKEGGNSGNMFGFVLSYLYKF